MSLRSRWNEGFLHLEVLQNADRAFFRSYAMQHGFRNTNRPLWNTGAHTALPSPEAETEHILL